MDTNLLSITSVPISIEVNIVKGSLQNPNAPKPQIKVSTDNGGVQIEAEPAKINIDTYAARSSLGYGHYNSTDFNKKEAGEGIKIAYEGVAKIVNEGNSLARGSKPSEIAIQNNRAGATIQTVMEFLPKTGADVTFDKGKLNINYDMADVNIDWQNIEPSKLQFKPGSIEFVVKQRPRIEIEYVGDPIYVPRSADPNYDPPEPIFNTTG